MCVYLYIDKVITGAACGIGKATAHKFAKSGHKLLLLDTNEEALGKLVDELASEQGTEKNIDRINWEATKCMSIVEDVSESIEIFHRAVSDACSYFKCGVSCLVNNAGIMCLGDIATQDEEEWLKMFKVNAVIYICIYISFK